METQRHAAANWKGVILQRNGADVRTTAVETHGNAQRIRKVVSDCGPWHSARYLQHTGNITADRIDRTRRDHRDDILETPRRTTCSCTLRSTPCRLCLTSCQPAQEGTIEDNGTQNAASQGCAPTLAAYVDGKLET